jgi:hypothetical protein
MRSRPRLLHINCIYGGADRWGSRFSVLVGQEGGCWCAEERSAVQCGAGEGEDFDGGREGVALDILRQVENGTFRSCSSPEQCSARKRLGRERPKNAGSLQQAVNPCPRLQHLAIMGAREHRRGRAIVFPVSCSNSIHTGDCTVVLPSDRST